MRRFLLLGPLVAVVAWGGAALAAHPAHGSVHRVSAVSLKASDTAPAPGERVVFRGRVTPSAAGKRLRFQQRDGGRWRTVATPRVSDSSYFSLARRLTSAGSVAYRVQLPGGAQSAASFSPT